MKKAAHPGAALPLWEGFLEEEAVAPGVQALSWPSFQRERVLITGAGGYLGAACAQALASCGVQSICLLDVVEHGLYELQQHLETRHPGLAYELVLGSVQDGALLREVVRRCSPTLVLHAAALKHVPMLESNACAAAAVNVLGTAKLLEALRNSSVRRVVVCSTDKAVQPVGIMGATKKLAEAVALNDPMDVRVLRLCNVLGSTGSVAPRFAEQIARGEPLTITDRDATRLWIAQREAVHCLLDGMHEDLPTRLAIPRRVQSRHVMELAGFLLTKADVSAQQLAFTGLRRGERLSETLHGEDETLVVNRSVRLTSLTPSTPPNLALQRLLEELAEAVRERDENGVRQRLGRVMAAAVGANA